MNFQLISDIHGKYKRIEFDKKADIILLAGDLSEDLNLVFHILSSSPIPILYIPGNHEFYDKDYYDFYNRIQDFCDKSNGKAIFLDNKTVEIDDVRVIGATLWSDFENFNPFLVENTWVTLNDYRKIRLSNLSDFMLHSLEMLRCKHTNNIETVLSGDNQKEIFYMEELIKKRTSTFGYSHFNELSLEHFSPHFSYILNKQNKAWLTDALEQPFDGKTIVMTHHSPSYTPLLLGKYLVSPFEDVITQYVKRKSHFHKIGGYCNSLENVVIKNNVDAWVHGHFHELLNYRLGNASVFCNAMGNYKNQEMGYRNFIFNTDSIDKKKALKNQLASFEATCYDLINFIEIHLEEKNKLSEVSSLTIIKSFWKEIEILLNSIHSLPMTEIYEPFHQYYPNPFKEFENKYDELNYNEVIFLLENILEEIENIYYQLKEWIDKL